MGTPGAAAPSNSTATVSLVLGILSIFCFGFLSGIPAIFLGISGKKKADQMGGVGRGAAQGGLVTGIIGSVLSVLGIILWIILLATASTTTSHTLDNLNKSIDKANKEYADSQSRNGKEAKTTDYEISGASVDVGSYGYITYKAFIQNDASFDTSYTIQVKCTGSAGDNVTESTSAYSLQKGDKQSFTAYLTMDSSTTSAECNVTSVKYGY
jgi:hypothetical protein